MRRFKPSSRATSRLLSAGSGSTGALFALLSAVTLISGCSADDDCAARRTCLSEGAEGGIGGEAAETAGGASGSAASSDGKGGQGDAGRGGTGAGGKGGSSGEGAQTGDAGGAAGEGDAGSSSDGTSAGEGGGGPAECERHSDCSDGFFCSGLERCEAGRCVDGPSPCEGMASDGCDAVCVESADECVVRASDRDEDGSPSAACAQDPGDDCNDAESSVYPGSPEVCDGLDNDCNGLTDLVDGLALGGTSASLSQVDRIDLAWSSALDGFGTALGELVGSEYSLAFATLTKEGDLGEPVRLLPGTALNTPRILWNGDEFGILSREWACSSEGDACSGRRAIVELSVGGDPTSFLDFGVGAEYAHDFARIGEDWAFSLVASGRAYVGRVAHATGGLLLSPPLNAEGTTALDPRMAFDAARVAVAWREGSGIHWAPLSNELEPQGAYEIPATAPGGLAFGVTPEGYAFAWNIEGGVGFQRAASDGEPACGPTFVPFGDHASAGASLALADFASGTLVLAVDGGQNVLALFRFGPECELVDETTVVGDGQAIENPVIAVGEGAVALGWSATTEDFAETAFYRVAGGNLCD